MSGANRSFLGTGWSFPPTFSRLNNGLNMVSDDQDIRESLWLLFSTSLGERILLPEYGSQIWKMVYQNLNNTLKHQIIEFIEQAIISWEPRINVDDITVEQDNHAEGVIQITVHYTIINTNTRNNLVYPFYILEGTIPVKGP
ncbi:MAG: GPW/gp25 family protein [Magnetococcales bacterium]|nr:GPW/gp25 family protein [Magnetococcales bacterium]